MLAAQNLNFVRYVKSDGFDSKYTYAFSQDNFGYLWIGTSEGLIKFNGNSFQYFKEGSDHKYLNGRAIISLMKDTEGMIWAGTDNGGVNKINPQTGTIVNFQTKQADTSSLSSNKVSCIFQDRLGQIWVGASGLNLYNPATSEFKRIQPFNDIQLLKKYNGWQLEFYEAVHDPCDSIIVWLTAAYGICRFNVRSLEAKYFFPPGEPTAFRSSYLDNSGNLWITDWGTGLLRFNIKNGKFEKFTVENTICNSISAISPLDTSQLLLATSRCGLVIFNTSTYQFKRIGDQIYHSEFPTDAMSFFEDKNKNVWVGTADQGLFCLQPHRQLYRKYFLNDNIRQTIMHPVTRQIYACSEQTNLYIGHDKTRKFQIHTIPEFRKHASSGFIDLEFDSLFNLWILSYIDLLFWDDKRKRFTSLQCPQWPNYIKRIGYFWDFLIDKKRQVWLSSQTGGLICVNTQHCTIQEFKYDNENERSLFHDYSISKIYEDKLGQIWGANYNGFFCYSQPDQTFYNSSENPPASDGGIAFTGSRGITQDLRSNIWISAELNRIGIIRSEASIKDPVEIVEAVNDLAPSKVTSMVTDKKGYIWIGSEAGLTRIDPSNQAFNHFGESFGIPPVNNLSISGNNEILLSYSAGFILFNPDSMIIEVNPPETRITNFKIFDKSFYKELFDSSRRNVELNYDQNFFSIEYEAVDFTCKGKMDYFYKLEGLQKDWINAGSQQQVAFANLKGGNYIFRLKARNRDGVFSENGSTLNIIIKPPFWERMWFWIIVLCVSSFILFGIHRYRIRQILREEALKSDFNKQLAEVEMKALRAQMNPHFLFNSLNAIKFYVLKQDREKAGEYLNDFARLIRMVLYNSSQKVISLKQELEALELYMKIEKLRFDDQFDFEIKHHEKLVLEAIFIPPMLLQPYVENAIWHGLMHKKNGKGILKISIESGESSIIISIEDNGIGRQKAEEVKSKSAQSNKSMGMSITQNRMNFSELVTNLRFGVRIIDLYDDHDLAAGTRVIIEMKCST